MFLQQSELGSLAPIAAVMLLVALAFARWRSI